MENVQVLSNLERLVRERTADLKAVNDRLRNEIALRRKAEARARTRSLTDALTGLNNRRGFLARAGQRFRADQRAGRASWLLYADVDGLKAVNDGQGHAAGDRLLGRIGKAFDATFRDDDVVGRLGGDEFAVYGVGSPEKPAELRDRLVEALARGGRQDGLGIALSCGIVCCDPASALSFEAVLRAADAAMYAEKRAKRRTSLGSGAIERRRSGAAPRAASARRA
jgi:diguanylate cyclase (GGDEF)-like protein